MKKIIIPLLAIIIILVAFVLVQKGKHDGYAVSPAPVVATTTSPLTATYEINGKKIALQNGKFVEKAAPGSSEEITTEIFGEPVLGQMGFGEDTAVMFLTQRGAGTGIFYYAAVAYKEGWVYKGTNAFLLGDRIAPQNIRIAYSEAQINYTIRKADEPMTAKPSVGVTKFLVLKDGVLQEK